MKRRKDGRWQKSIYVNGKRIYFYSSEESEKSANRDIQKQMVEYQKKSECGSTFAEIAEKWLNSYLKTIPYTTYKKSISASYNRILSYFDKEYIKQITSKDIDIFLNKLNYGYKTTANHKSIINMIFNYAALNGYIEHNPVTVIRLPKNLKRTPRELPTTEELKIVSSHWEGFDLLPYFLLFTGCRKSEALGITRENIDFQNKVINIQGHVIHDGNQPIYEHVLKSDAAKRKIIILDRLYNVLPKNFDGFLFSMEGDGKRPLSKGAFDKRWKKYCSKYRLNITAHQLRHGFATMLFEAGVDVKDAQNLMGHSDINLTHSIYTHIRETRLKETADKLNNFNF